MNFFLAAVVVLFALTAFSLGRRAKRGRGFSRRSALPALGLTWVMIMASRWLVPDTLIHAVGLGSLPGVDEILILDGTTWTLAAGVITLLLVHTLWERPGFEHRELFYASGAVGMLAASAANLVSLLAFWVLLDVLWLSGASLRPTWEGSPTDGLFMLIPAVGGPLILLVGAVLSIRSGYTAAFSGFSPALSYLLVGAGLARLGVFLPSRSPRRKNEQVSRNPWVARFPASAAGLVLVIRAAEIRAGLPGGKGGGWTLLLVAGLGLALLLWRSRKTLFLSWTLGTYLLTVLAWRYGLPAPALAWGGVFFLVGAVLSYPNHRKFNPRWGAGAAILGLCGLPFTPLGPARQIYLPEHGGWPAAGAAGFFIGSVIVYLLGLGDQEQVSSKPEVSEVILGLGLVVGTQLFVAFPLHTPLTDWELGQEILWGGLPLGVAGGVYFLNVYVLGEFLPLARPHPPGMTALREAAAWVIRALFRAAGGPVRLFSDLLEGRGGLVWALLSAFLLISLLMGR